MIGFRRYFQRNCFCGEAVKGLSASKNKHKSQANS